MLALFHVLMYFLIIKLYFFQTLHELPFSLFLYLKTHAEMYVLNPNNTVLGKHLIQHVLKTVPLLWSFVSQSHDAEKCTEYLILI